MEAVRHHPAWTKNEMPVSQEEWERMVESCALNEKLGLRGQEVILRNKLWNLEIEKIAEEKNYPKVNDQLLEELFEIKKLEKTINKDKRKEERKENLSLVCLLIVVFGVFISPDMYTIFKYKEFFWGDHVSTGMGALGFFGTLFGAMTFMGICGGMWELLRTDYFKVVLEFEGIEHTKIEICYGAKLRLQEAKETKLFDKFLICYPSIKDKATLLKDDPAIIGVTSTDMEERRLVVCWDVEKDKEKIIDRIIPNIEDLRMKKI